MLRPAAAATLLGLAACQEPARELAREPGGTAGARALVEALALRFGPARHEPALEALRTKLAQGALVPSRIVDDPAAWPIWQADRRTVELTGHGSLSSGYQVGVRAEAAPPRAPGDYRGRIRLQRTGNGRYEWNVTEELAVGPVRLAALAASLDALVGAADSLDGASARAAVRRAFPRASPPLGRLLRLETLDLWREGGGTRVDVAVRLVPDSLAPTAPRLAEFVRRYLGPMRLHAVARDAASRDWWTLDASQGLWTLRLRVREGRLRPLQGPAEAGVPDELRVTADFATRMGRFGVGARRIAASLTLVRTPAEKGVVARFLEEPKWDLPFLVEPLLHGPLSHPFDAPGSEAGFSALEGPGGETRLVRQFRVRVRETWILRWLSGLTSGAMSDFRAGPEAELDEWARECLLAVRDDVAALAR
jgi:hypothetical protein